MPRTTIEKRMSIEEQIRQLEKQRRQLLQRERAEEREEVNQRLQRRGKYIESLVAGAVEMGDEEFFGIVKDVFDKLIVSEPVSDVPVWGGEGAWTI